MRRGLLVVLALLLVLSVVPISCAKPAPAPPPAPPAPTPAPEPVKLVYSAWTLPPAPGRGAQAFLWPLEEIVKRGGGRIELEQYWSGTLIPAKEEVEAVGKGVADFATVFTPFVMARLSLIDVAALPGFGTSLRQQGPAVDELVKMKAVQDQFAANNLVFTWMNVGDPIDVISRTPIRSADDLKGLKIRASGTQAKHMKALGAVPVALTSEEAPEALERGTVDGIMMSYMGISTWSLQEIAKYHTEIEANTNLFYTFMNRDTWLALPDDVKQIFRDVAAESSAAHIRIYEEMLAELWNVVWPKAGVEVIKPSPEFKAALTEAAKPLWDDWAKKQNEKGLPGTEVLNRWKEIRGIK